MPEVPLLPRDQPLQEVSLASDKSPDGGLKQEISTELPPRYQDSGYNRNSTQVARYVCRILDDFPTPSERYYDIRLLACDNRRSYFGEVGDQCIMFHSNRICLLTLAPSHPVIVGDKNIERLEYKFEGFEKIDRLSSQPQGKSKKGSQKLQKNSPICSIICSDGSKYVVTAGLASKLIEINSLIISKPNLIKDKPLSTGFIAILQPSDWKRMAEVRDGLPKLGIELQTDVSKDEQLIKLKIVE